MKNIFIIGRKRKLSIFNSIKLVIYTGIYQLKSKKSIIVLPGVIKFLEILRKKEIKVAIVTSSRRKNVDRFLSNIRRNDILCISRDDTRNWKPHPDSIYKAFEMINSNGDSAIYLGDFPIDIIAGKKANIMTGGIFGNKPVGFKKQLEKYKPDILVSNVLKAIRYILETN